MGCSFLVRALACAGSVPGRILGPLAGQCPCIRGVCASEPLAGLCPCVRGVSASERVSSLCLWFPFSCALMAATKWIQVRIDTAMPRCGCLGRLRLRVACGISWGLFAAVGSHGVWTNRTTCGISLGLFAFVGSHECRPTGPSPLPDRPVLPSPARLPYPLFMFCFVCALLTALRC